MSFEKKISKISIKPEESILTALKKMDKLGVKSLLVLSSGNGFIGVISIGDIQRAIIRNESLDNQVNMILRDNPKVGKTGMSKDKIIQLLTKYRMEFLPVLNDLNKIIDCYFWEDLFPGRHIPQNSNLNLPVVIMAGGKGTRLKPLTNIIPKPLLPIGEKTILETIMDKFMDIGCSAFYLSVNYKADSIRHYFDTLERNNYTISYFKEDKPLGTIGSLFLLKRIINQTFFISNCDIIIEEDYSEIYKYHKANSNEITIVAALKHYPIPYGTIETGENGKLITLTEKPELTFKINSGMYILEPHLLLEIPNNSFYHITDLIEKVKKRKGQIGVFPVSEKSWKDIGNWSEYKEMINL